MKKLILGIFLAVWWCGNHACAQDIAAKTNLLYWATTTPNIGMEFGLGEQTTLELTGGYNRGRSTRSRTRSSSTGW